MLESTVEDYLREQVEAHGGRCEKVIDQSRRGHPDREIQWPSRSVLDGYWLGALDKAELKKPDGEPEAHQTRYHTFLARCSVPVYLLDTKHKVDVYIAARSAGRRARELFSVPVPFV